jgi:hypothetical protein
MLFIISNVHIKFSQKNGLAAKHKNNSQEVSALAKKIKIRFLPSLPESKFKNDRTCYKMS